VNGQRREVAFLQDFVEFDGSFDLRDEDDDLIEEQVIEEIGKFLGLFGLFDVDVVLEDTFEDKLGFIIDKDFLDVLSEFGGKFSDFLGEGGREHHDLLVDRSLGEDLSDISSHVYI
jgi:hypothetical protein